MNNTWIKRGETKFRSMNSDFVKPNQTLTQNNLKNEGLRLDLELTANTTFTGFELRISNSQVLYFKFRLN